MWYNGIMLWLLRTPLHGIISPSVVAITFTGRKSGRQMTVPVSYVRDWEDLNRLLITSTPARTWWRNLRDGRPVILRLRGRNVSATPRVFEGESVIPPLTDFIRSSSNMAAVFDIKVTAGEPDPDGITLLAPSRVMIELMLEGED